VRETAALLCQKRVADPLGTPTLGVYLGHDDHVEPDPQPGEVPSLLKQLAGGPDEALLLAGVDAGGGSPIAIARTGADLCDHEDVVVTGDDIQLTEAAEVIALEDFETLGPEEVGGNVFSGLAKELLLRAAPAGFSRSASRRTQAV
jgi:hypothetical protein